MCLLNYNYVSTDLYFDLAHPVTCHLYDPIIESYCLPMCFSIFSMLWSCD